MLPEAVIGEEEMLCSPKKLVEIFLLQVQGSFASHKEALNLH